MSSLHNKLLFRQQAYIGGQWCDADDAATLRVNNPASGETIGTVPKMGETETRRAITAAQTAWEGWRVLTAKERGAILMKWANLLIENANDLAHLMTCEQGKPLQEAKSEIIYAASFLEWFSEEGKRVYGDTIQSPWPDKRILVLKEPIGVCAAITPWNFPAAMITRKAGPALAAGCPIVVKPAEKTPYSALALAVLAEEAGVPGGVFNVVTGNPEQIGMELTKNATVRKLSFTGSTRVGRLLTEQSASTLKKVSLELGGNASFIVFGDADIDAAVEGVMNSKFRNSGQTCVCANRVFVHDDIYELFSKKLVAQVKNLNVGNGFDQGVTQGPLIDDAAVMKVEHHVKDAIEKGGHLLVGGGRHALGGTFFEPTVVGNANVEMCVAREETFGPLAALFRFRSDSEVLAMANATEFGLASYFYSKDITRVWKIMEKLECGIVGVNTGIISNEMAPFGGVKQSGLGREGSRYGMDDYLTLKYVCVGGIK